MNDVQMPILVLFCADLMGFFWCQMKLTDRAGRSQICQAFCHYMHVCKFGFAWKCNILHLSSFRFLTEKSLTHLKDWCMKMSWVEFTTSKHLN